MHNRFRCQRGIAVSLVVVACLTWLGDAESAIIGSEQSSLDKKSLRPMAIVVRRCQGVCSRRARRVSDIGEFWDATDDSQRD